MIKRKKGLLELAARLPWWVYLIGAGLAYELDRPLAALLVPEDDGFGGMVDGFGSLLLIKLGTLMATGVMLCGALASFLGRAGRRRQSKGQDAS